MDNFKKECQQDFPESLLTTLMEIITTINIFLKDISQFFLKKIHCLERWSLWLPPWPLFWWDHDKSDHLDDFSKWSTSDGPHYLTHCDLITSYMWVYNGSDNGLLPDGTKPSPGAMLTYGFCGFHMKAISHVTLYESERWVQNITLLARKGGHAPLYSIERDSPQDAAACWVQRITTDLEISVAVHSRDPHGLVYVIRDRLTGWSLRYQ